MNDCIDLALVVGTRPHYVKLSAILRALNERDPTAYPAVRPWIIDTGQHYDWSLRGRFYHELGLPAPAFQLQGGSGTHAVQTARMLMGVEEALMARPPTAVAVFGDTNTTLAGALAAKKLGLPVVHIEAGLRSGDLQVPEEVNRVATDHMSDLLFCACPSNYESCVTEGLQHKSVWVGDVTFDTFLQFRAQGRSQWFPERRALGKRFVVASIHRGENTDQPERLTSILAGLGELGCPVLLPVHPRLRQAMQRCQAAVPTNILAAAPLGYDEMATALRDAELVVTDSSGLQREAFFWRVPCVVARHQQEWLETIRSGWAINSGPEAAAIVAAAARFRAQQPENGEFFWFGSGDASHRIVSAIAAHFGGYCT